jgi:hypothetical protein
LVLADEVGGQIVALGQQHFQAAPGSIARDTGSVDAAPTTSRSYSGSRGGPRAETPWDGAFALWRQSNYVNWSIQFAAVEGRLEGRLEGMSLASKHNGVSTFGCRAAKRARKGNMRVPAEPLSGRRHDRRMLFK